MYIIEIDQTAQDGLCDFANQVDRDISIPTVYLVKRAISDQYEPLNGYLERRLPSVHILDHQAHMNVDRETTIVIDNVG